jgi:hypothetical protein
MASLYETDYFKWAMETAAALRERRLQDVDLEATAEEIEDLGKSERRSLHSALVQLFLHLLKTRHQPDMATVSWQISIEKQRRQVARIIKENPSLRQLLCDAEFLEDAYGDAVLDAVGETGLSRTLFPPACPFRIADIL